VKTSAGNWSFIENIKKLSNNYKFYDIAPENEEIIKKDFLKLDYCQLKQEYKKNLLLEIHVKHH